MTLILNFGAGQFVAWLNGFGRREGFYTTVILQNRGEFALILATLSLSAGLDSRIQPFAGLYVLIMAVLVRLLWSTLRQSLDSCSPANDVGRVRSVHALV